MPDFERVVAVNEATAGPPSTIYRESSGIRLEFSYTHKFAITIKRTSPLACVRSTATPVKQLMAKVVLTSLSRLFLLAYTTFLHSLKVHRIKIHPVNAQWPKSVVFLTCGAIAAHVIAK